ncbi:thioredoxin family protein [Nocardioides caeni]|uniref:Thioredoxin family protein n=1 Tax=Nocardioides caeni TaxID=574700 RepID=A0A4S8N0G0_9ACTN|nr:thioredoxin family protein [Nocardioides caeni]THV09223.1 thioredoxin family protein [Nocardioides caeni]
MNPGLVVLLVALAAATAFGLWRRRTDGRFAAPGRRGASALPVRRGASASERLETPATPTPDPATPISTPSPWSALTAVLPSATLGERATFVQFSSAFCAPCRTTRVLLADVAGKESGVAHVEIDAEEHLALVRELDIRRTPTTLVLDATGAEIARAAGAPRREQVLAALPQEVR